MLFGPNLITGNIEKFYLERNSQRVKHNITEKGVLEYNLTNHAFSVTKWSIFSKTGGCHFGILEHFWHFDPNFFFSINF